MGDGRTPGDPAATGREADQAPAVFVNPVAFEELLPEEGRPPPARPEAKGNLDLILDVDVQVTAAIGNVRKSIGEILSLTEGQVIDMERSAGEPVDLLVNGKLVAHGEVVVIDERYGIRIAEIVAPPERLGR